MGFIKKLLPLFLIILSSGLSGCTTIPKESVTLSQEVGKGIAENQRAYLNLFNLYFAEKKQQIDRAIIDEFLPNYIRNVQEELRKGGENPNSFDAQMVRDMIGDVIEKRDELQEDLERTKNAIWETISKDHILLLQANATITALLQSAVSLKKAASPMERGIKEVKKKSRFSFDEFERLFNEHLKKVGKISTKAKSLYDTMRPFIGSGGGQ